MTCPYCNAEMKQGFVQSDRFIIFGEDKKGIFKAPKEGKDEFYIGYRDLFGAYKDACYCATCKKVIMDI